METEKLMETEKKERVVLAGLDVPFWDLVWFMVKFVFASIPAIFIIYVILFVLGMVFTGLGNVFMPTPGGI